MDGGAAGAAFSSQAEGFQGGRGSLQSEIPHEHFRKIHQRHLCWRSKTFRGSDEEALILYRTAHQESRNGTGKIKYEVTGTRTEGW